MALAIFPLLIGKPPLGNPFPPSLSSPYLSSTCKMSFWALLTKNYNGILDVTAVHFVSGNCLGSEVNSLWVGAYRSPPFG